MTEIATYEHQDHCLAHHTRECDDCDCTPIRVLSVGDNVTAQNPGGREITGTLLGYDEHGFAQVEWFGPWFYEGARRYVGTFAKVEAV